MNMNIIKVIQAITLIILTPSVISNEKSGYPSPKDEAILSMAPQIGTVDSKWNNPIYLYSEDAHALNLGQGFSPRDLSDRKAPCLNYTEKKLDGGAVKSKLELLYVRSEKELNFALGIDSNVSASFLGSKAETKHSFSTSNNFSDSNVTVIMRAWTDYGKWGLDSNIKLSDVGEKYISNHKDFENNCGSHYVSAERRGSSVYVIIKLYSVDARSKNKFVSAIGGGGSWGDIGAKAKSQLNIMIEAAFKQNRAEMKVEATGGEGMSALRKVLEGIAASDTAPLDKMFTSMSEALETFDSDNAVVTKYYSSSMSQFGWDAETIDPWTDLHQRYLRNLADDYLQATNDLEDIKEIEAGNHIYNKLSNNGRNPPQSIINVFIDRKDYVENEIYRIATIHKNCMKTSDLTECESMRYSSIQNERDKERWKGPAFFNMETSKGLTKEQLRLLMNTPRKERERILKQIGDFDNTFVVMEGLENANNILSYSIKIEYTLSNKRYSHVYYKESANGPGYASWTTIPINKSWLDREERLLKFFKTGSGKFENGVMYYHIKTYSGIVYDVPILYFSHRVHNGVLFDEYMEYLF
ncbi:hypothetical protein [Vibrio sp.]|uniref:hypothetical protein n=1 Tax=Vibrio sp. TaxID=678 RepID=UPI003AA80843